MVDPNLLYSTKAVLQLLLNNRDAYYTIDTLADEFFKYAGYKIPYYDLGYRFLDTFFLSIPDLLRVEPVTNRVYRQPPFPSYVFCPQGLQSNPGMNNYSNYNRVQFKQQHNHSTKVNDFRQRQPSNHSSDIRPSKATILSPKIPDKNAKQIQKNIALLDNRPHQIGKAKGDRELLSPRKNGDVESVTCDVESLTVDVVTPETSIIESRKVITFSETFSNYENLTATKIHSPEVGEPNVSHMDSGDHIDNEYRVETKIRENEGDNMPCFDLKENETVNEFSNYENLTATKIHSPEVGEPNVSHMDSGDHIDNGYRVETKIRENEGDNMPCFDLKENETVNEFSNYENLTATKIHSPEVGGPNVSHMDSGDHIDNGYRVETKIRENEGDNMPCFDLKENETVNEFSTFGEKFLWDRNNASSEKTALISNSSNSSESELPPYSEKGMSNVAGATTSNETDNTADELKKESVDIRVDAGFYSSDSSDDEMPHKPNPDTFPMLYKNVALPFISDDDPILMIGSKYSNERYGKIKTVDISSKMEVGRFYEIYISEVNSPYKFWFQLADYGDYDDDDDDELSQLGKYLNMFYNTSLMSTDDHIKEIFMRKGYPCAALYCHQWHRAEFIGKPKNKEVKVFFVDYGTVAKVATSDVRYLLNRFCTLPRLCYRGILDFITPKHERWEREASAYFCELIRDVKLVAGVSEINTKHNSARIYVMDRSRDILVNRELVENGYAFPEDPRDRCQNHVAELLPTFESLEKGEFPSLSETFEYLGQDFDPEEMFETTVIDEVDCYIPQHMSDEQAMERIQTFYREKEMAKEITAGRDATAFLNFFERILKNPFLNGKAFQVAENKNVSSTNPFSDDL